MLIFYNNYLITIEKSEYDLENIWYGYVALAGHPDFHFWDCTVQESSLASAIAAAQQSCDANSRWYGFSPNFLNFEESWYFNNCFDIAAFS